MKTILYIHTILFTLAFLPSCTNSMNTGDPNPNIEKPKPGDVDGDGILDKDDNCPTLANADQADKDGDGIGDVCEDLKCASNLCQDAEVFSGYLCDEDESIRCEVKEDGCVVEMVRSTCGYGCQTEGLETGLCEGPPEDPTSPKIDNVTGSASNGGTMTLTGSNLGTHTMDISSGVGPNGWIEKNALGKEVTELTNAPGWENNEVYSSRPYPKISNRIVRNGDHAIEASLDESTYGSAESLWPHRSLEYLRPETFDKIYFSFYVYFDPIYWRAEDTTLNTKWFFIGHHKHHSQPSIFLLHYSNIVGTVENPSWSFNLHSRPWAWCPDEDTGIVFSQVEPEPYYHLDDPRYYTIHDEGGQESLQDNGATIGGWTRFQGYFDASDVDVFNGYAELYMIKENKPLERIFRFHKLLNHASCARDVGTGQNGWGFWKRLNLFGFSDDINTRNPALNTVADWFWDDIYIQIGTRARIEIGDQPDYYACSKLDTQVPQTWSTNSIAFEVNHGTFQPGDTVYVYVIRDDGKISEGMPMVLE